MIISESTHQTDIVKRTTLSITYKIKEYSVDILVQERQVPMRIEINAVYSK